MCYYIAQIFGSYMIGYILDLKSMTRRTRAFVGWGILFVMVFIIHGWAYIYQRFVPFTAISSFRSLLTTFV